MVKEMIFMKREIHFGNALASTRENQGHSILHLLHPLYKSKVSVIKEPPTLLTVSPHYLQFHYLCKDEKPPFYGWASSEDYTVSQEHSTYTGKQMDLESKHGESMCTPIYPQH